MKTIDLVFDGYWRDPAKANIPNQSGIYCVYACTHDATEKTVSIRDLLYIGESFDVRGRLQYHDRHDDWMKKLKAGEVLCYSFAPVPTVDRERAEAALIFKCQPPLNDEHKGQFIYNDTKITTSGKNRKLPPLFEVNEGATK